MKSYSENPIIQDLTSFLQASPTAWHAVSETKERLRKAGFLELQERDSWQLKKGGKYYTTRNGSSLCAFILPKTQMEEGLFLGSHTDSPALKLKPNPESWVDNSLTWSSEVYGGPVLPSWFNRELCLAGRIVVKHGGNKPSVKSHLIHIDEPLAIIPQLAIHLNSQLGNEHKVDRQKHLSALVTLGAEKNKSLLTELLKRCVPKGSILASELFLLPYQAPSLTGPKQEFISSPRLDNLLSAHATLAAFCQQAKAQAKRLSCFITWDNEEVGSDTAQGAGSSFLGDVLTRIHEFYGSRLEDRIRFQQSSLCVSVDAAHASHPNFKDKHDEQHLCLLGKGPVVKINAQQRYASDALSTGALHAAGQKGGIPIQSFVMRTDMRCGSTIGPIVSTQLGIRTVDLGAPILSMHGARELGACADHLSMVQLMETLLGEKLDGFLAKE